MCNEKTQKKDNFKYEQYVTEYLHKTGIQIEIKRIDVYKNSNYSCIIPTTRKEIVFK